MATPNPNSNLIRFAKLGEYPYKALAAAIPGENLVNLTEFVLQQVTVHGLIQRKLTFNTIGIDHS
jgi:hypothetical protein